MVHTLSAAEQAAVLLALLGVRRGHRVLVVGGDHRLAHAAAAAAGEQGRVDTDDGTSLAPLDRLLLVTDEPWPALFRPPVLAERAARLVTGGRAVACTAGGNEEDLLAAAGLEQVGRHAMATAAGRRTALVGLRRPPSPR